MANHNLGTIRGTIEIDYDGAGIVKAIKDTDRLGSTSERLDGASSRVLSSFGKFGKGALIAGGAISTVTNTAGLLVGTLSVLGPLTAAGFAAAPAVIAGYNAALIVAKLSVAGVGEALKAATEDEKKFEEALKGLSPEAQKFARAYKESLPQLKAVQQAMQDAFFRGTAGQVGQVADRVASLGPSATRVAGTLGEVATNIVKTATSGRNLTALRAILDGVNSFLQRIKTSLGPVITGFLDAARQGAAFGDIAGQKVGNALATLARWLSSLDIGATFRRAGPIVQSLGQFLGDVATIAKELFSIFVGEGGNAAGVLATLASNLATFLQSAAGQEALSALRDAFTVIGGSVGQVFLTLLQALAPVIVALAPAMAQLSTQMAGVLVPAIQAVNPLLVALAGFLSQNMSWIGPLAGVVGAAAGAYKIYAAAVTAVTAVKTALNSQLAINTAAWIRNTAAMVAQRAAAVATAAVTGGAAVAAWAANTAAVVANRVATLASQAAMLVVRGATVAWTAVQWALNAALSANPIGLVVIAIAAFIAIVITAYKNSETFRKIVDAAWKGIQAAISAVVDWVTGTAWPAIKGAWKAIADGTKNLWNSIKSAWNSIRNTIQTVLNAIKSIVRAAWNAIVSFVRAYLNTYKNIVKAAFNAAKAVIQTVLNTVRGVVRTVWNNIVAQIRSAINTIKTVIRGVRVVADIVRDAFNRAKTAITNVLRSAISVVRSFPGRVRSALGNLGRLLYNSGKALIQGFINGIKAMAARAASAAKGVVSGVARFLPGSPAEEGPLSGRGYVLYRAQRMMGDFAKGIESRREVPRTALQAATGRLVRPVVSRRSGIASNGFQDALNAIRDRIPARGGSGGGGDDYSDDYSETRTYNIRIGEKQFATLVVDAITGNPVAVAKAVNEGNRKNQWSGSGRIKNAMKVVQNARK